MDSESTVTNMIRESCLALWDVLKDEVLLAPGINEWNTVTKEFNNLWQLSNCFGAIVGKHVVMQALPKTDSQFFNYKKRHSLVLLALCDAKYRFTMVDIGAKGEQSDGGIFRNSQFGQQLLTNNLNIPGPQPIEYGGDSIPNFIAWDEAFPLTFNTMRHYPGHYLDEIKRIFNYRLIRGRRVIKNAFGILCSRWRIFRKPVVASIETVEAIIQATICLHNFIKKHEEVCKTKLYCPSNLIHREGIDGNILEGEWLEDERIPRLGANTYRNNANHIREQLALYFVGDEETLPLQWNK